MYKLGVRVGGTSLKQGPDTVQNRPAAGQFPVRQPYFEFLFLKDRSILLSSDYSHILAGGNRTGDQAGGAEVGSWGHTQATLSSPLWSSDANLTRSPV